MPLSLPVRIFKKSDLDDPNLTLLNQFFTELVQAVNQGSGFAGTVAVHSDLNLQGNKVTNVGDPASGSDLVTLAYALQQFGAAAIRPQLEATGSNPLQSVRRLNDTVQRENYSSFLNNLMSTAPTANTATITGTPSGSSTVVVVTSGLLQRMDRTTSPFASRSDTLANSTSYSLTSVTRNSVSGVVTADIGSTFTNGNNSQITVSGVADPSFDGTFVVISGSGTTTITWGQTGVTASSTGGTASVPGVYYYMLAKGAQTLSLVTPSGADSWSARVQGSYDGNTLVAVAVLNASGLDGVNSGAGATVPVTNASLPVIRRL